MKKSILTLLIFTLISNCFAEPIEKNRKYRADEYLDIQNKYKYSIKKHTNSTQIYNSIQENVFKNHSNTIKDFWPEVELSSKKKWVEYSPEFSSKKVIDFKNKKILLSVIEEDENKARIQIKKLFSQLLEDTTKSAYENETIENEILLLQEKTKLQVQSSNKIIGDILNSKEIEQLSTQIDTKKLNTIKYNEDTIYKIALDLPKNMILRSAKKYSKLIDKTAKKYLIPPKLIFALIHVESSYNPMGRLMLPSYGLMQIIPNRIGLKGYQFIFNKQGTPTPSYLYNVSNNINIGSAYLHLLFHKNLNGITNEKTKLYCIIASYNYGLDEIIKLFAGSYDIEKATKQINTMSSEEVYQFLQDKLPNVNSKIYLKLVIEKMKLYSKFLEQNSL